MSSHVRPHSAAMKRRKKKSTKARSKHTSLSTFYSPYLYPVLLVALYAVSFIESPLGWWNTVEMDFRYTGVYAVFVCAYLGGYVLGRPPTFIQVQTSRAARLTGRTPGKRFMRRTLSLTPVLTSRSTHRVLIVLSFALFCLLAAATKSGGLAIFSSNPVLFRRDFGTELGGFVLYPTFLLTTLAIVSAVQWRLTKRRFWLLIYLICVLSHVVQLNRQEMLICLVAPFMVGLFNTKVSFKSVLIGMAGLVIAAYALGTIAIFRYGGAELISRSITGVSLPFLVFLSDLTGTIRLGHDVIDAVGPGGLQNTYVWGVFISIVDPSYETHGALAVRDLFTASETAQSIPSPLSYYADGGTLSVLGLGIIQGVLIGLLWRLARSGDLFSRILYVMNMLALLWTIRSGTVSFSPIFLLQFASLCFIFSEQIPWRGVPKVISQLAAIYFVLVIPVVALALAVRF